MTYWGELAEFHPSFGEHSRSLNCYLLFDVRVNANKLTSSSIPYP